MKKSNEKPNYQIIIEAILKAGIELTEQEKAGIEKAFSSRGSYKNYLKKNKPTSKGNCLAAACWLGMQPNAYKIGIMSVMMLNGSETTIYRKLSDIKFPAAIDKDMQALQALGVW